MTEKQRMKYGLQVVRASYESEVLQDKHSIMELLRDPSISPPAEGEPVSYGVHVKFHHLAIHQRALEEIDKMMAEIESMAD